MLGELQLKICKQKDLHKLLTLNGNSTSASDLAPWSAARCGARTKSTLNCGLLQAAVEELPLHADQPDFWVVRLQ
jgi:hypothetical protein